MSIEGKVAIITGAAGGIGSAITKRFLNDGVKVVASDVDQEKGQALLEALKDQGDVIFNHCDVGDKLDVHNMLAATLAEFGQVDILVNNAGVTHNADFLSLEEDDFDRVMRINLKGMFLCGQAVARHMIKADDNGSGRGAIINMSSINDTVAIPTQVPYSISKGGVSQLTRVMALSLAPYNIRVNAIGPGSIMTDMLKSVNNDPDARNLILSRTPLGRVGEASEVASIAAFLASDDASYMTGSTLYADGGRLPLNYTVAVPDDS